MTGSAHIDGERSYYCPACLYASSRCICPEPAPKAVMGFYPKSDLGYFIRLFERQITELQEEVAELKRK